MTPHRDRPSSFNNIPREKLVAMAIEGGHVRQAIRRGYWGTWTQATEWARKGAEAVRALRKARSLALAGERGKKFKSKVTHCPQGHAYTPENVYYYENAGKMKRRCRTCVNAKNHDWNALRREEIRRRWGWNHHTEAMTMTTADRDARIFAMFEAGKSYTEICRELQIRPYVCNNAVRRHRQRLGLPPGKRGARRAADRHPDWEQDGSGDRCRCGLRLPCNDCVAPLYHFATARREAA